MDTQLPSEEDLHAYLDGESPLDKREAVKDYLGRSPEDARRFQAYRTDGEVIAKLFARADEIAPKSLHPSLAALRQAWPFRLPGKVWPTKVWQFAAAVALLVLAGGLGLLWQKGNVDARGNQFATEAAAAHLLAATSTTPAEIPLEEIARFLSEPLSAPVKLRHQESGEYRLVASRFVTTPRGRVVQMTFRSPEQNVITMYLEPWPGTKDTSFRPVNTGHRDVTTLVWTDDEVACAVTGTLPPDRLEQIARSLYEAIFS